MKKRNIMYAAIIAICIISIIIAVYYQFFAEKVVKTGSTNDVENRVVDDPVDDPKDILAEFNRLLTNTFDKQGNDIENVGKYEGLESFDIVYTLNNGIKEEQQEKYDINVNLPVVNIAKASKLNDTTQNKFADKVTKILAGTSKYTIYNIDYAAYLNDNILSVVIKATLKEGNSAQKVIVQTYNYDIENDKEVSLNDMLDKYGIKVKDVNRKIEKQIKEASKQAEIISEATGQIVYKRDLYDKMYTTDQANNFFIGKDKQIYIIYAYGNNYDTSELDIIKV